MLLPIDRIPDVCPICGEDLSAVKEELGKTGDNMPGVFSCPNCDFQINLMKDGAEEIVEMMEREHNKIPPDYQSVVGRDDTPGEDAMLEYR